MCVVCVFVCVLRDWSVQANHRPVRRVGALRWTQHNIIWVAAHLRNSTGYFEDLAVVPSRNALNDLHGYWESRGKEGEGDG